MRKEILSMCHNKFLIRRAALWSENKHTSQFNMPNVLTGHEQSLSKKKQACMFLVWLSRAGWLEPGDHRARSFIAESQWNKQLSKHLLMTAVILKLRMLCMSSKAVCKKFSELRWDVMVDIRCERLLLFLVFVFQVFRTGKPLFRYSDKEQRQHESECYWERGSGSFVEEEASTCFTPAQIHLVQVACVQHKKKQIFS